MTLRLLLVRHGLSTFNIERRIQGRNDLSTLTQEGRSQALQAGEALLKIPINEIYSSPLRRAAETTKNLIKCRKDNLIPIMEDGLLEVDLGIWSGLTAEEIEKQYPIQSQVWREDPKELTLQRDNGETFKPIEELIIQARTFLARLTDIHLHKEDQTILIVAHNAILRCLILELLKQPSKSFRKLQLDNASISVFNLNSIHDNQYQVQIECLNNTSHLQPPIPRKATKKARLILVRHGETDWNKEGRFQGQIDIPLNHNGKDQAKAAGFFLKEIQIDKAISSSLTRPKQTAEEILKYHPDVQLEIQDGLVEIGHGLWEGKLESEIIDQWPKLLKDWKESPEIVQMPEGETIQDVWDRSISCWDEICSQLTSEQTCLVVAHDAVNKTILCNLLGLTPGDIWAVKQGNGGITIIDINNSSSQPYVVTCLNITTHIGGVLDCTATGAL